MSKGPLCQSGAMAFGYIVVKKLYGWSPREKNASKYEVVIS